MFWKKNRKHSVYDKLLNSIESLSPDVENQELNRDLSVNEKVLKEVFKDWSDIVFRPIQIGGQAKLLLIYIDGLSDSKILDQVVLKPFMFDGFPEALGKVPNVKQVIEQQLVALTQVQNISKIRDVVNEILKGKVALLADGESQALVSDLNGFEKRSIEEPR